MENKSLNIWEQTPFDSEFILHKLTEKYIKEKKLFGLKYVGSEIQYNKLRIDTLAYDEDKNTFVIIEYKNIKMGSKVIDQVQGYYNLIKHATEEDDSEVDIPQELAKRLGKNKNDIDFKNMHAMIIGPGLKDDFEKNAIPEYLEVYVISLCKCNDECYVTYEKKNSKEIMNCDSKEIRLEVDPKDLEITKEDVLKYKSPKIKTLYNDFERSLKQFYGLYNGGKGNLKQSNVIKFKYLVDAVSIKANNKFICNVTVKESIKIYFYTHKLNKINKMLDKDNCRKKNLRNIAYLSTGGPLVYFELTMTPCEIEYAIDVIKQIADAKNGGNKK